MDDHQLKIARGIPVAVRGLHSLRQAIFALVARIRGDGCVAGLCARKTRISSEWYVGVSVGGNRDGAVGGQSCCAGDTWSAWTAIPDIRVGGIQMRLVCVVGVLRGCRQRDGELDLPRVGIKSSDNRCICILERIFD